MHRVSLLLILLLATAPSQAGVVSRDLFEPGDGLLTYDDVNHREWLDFSASTGMSTNELSLATSAGGMLSDFRLAAGEDVFDLFRSGTPPDYTLPCYSLGPPECNRYANWFDLLGRVGDIQLGSMPNEERQPYTGGRISPIDSLTIEGVVFLAFVSSGPPEVSPLDFRFLFVVETGSPPVFDFPILWDEGYEPAKTNYWLYRDATPVPEPTAACLTLMACLISLRLRVFA